MNNAMSLKAKIRNIAKQKNIPAQVILQNYMFERLLVRLSASEYRANRPEDSDWVVLPVASFDAYFGSTNFSHKWLVKIPDTILTREKQSFGVCRYKENI